MNPSKRQSRAKRRAKTNRLTRMGVPCLPSKWAYGSEWKGPGFPLQLTPGDVQSNRRLARYADPFLRIERGAA